MITSTCRIEPTSGFEGFSREFHPYNVQPWDATGLNISTRVTERKEDRGGLTGGSADAEAISATEEPSNEKEKKKKRRKR